MKEWIWQWYCDNYYPYIDHKGKPRLSVPCADVAELYDLGMIAGIAKAVEEE